MSKAKLFDLETHSIFVSRDVVFHESVYPYASSSSGSTSSSILPLPCAPPISTLLDDPLLSKPSSSTLPHDSMIQVHYTINDDFLDDMLEEPPEPIADPIPLRRSSRSIKKHINHVSSVMPISSPHSGTSHPLSSHVSYQHLSLSYKTFCCAISSIVEPTF